MTILDERNQWAQQALNQLAGSPYQVATPIPNEQAVAAASSTIARGANTPSQSPTWVDYLGGIEGKIAQNRQQNPIWTPFEGGFPTQRRREFEESVRQFNEQMALQRAIQAAKVSSSESKDKARSEVSNYVRNIVDFAVKNGYGFDFVEQELVRDYGDFPEDFPYDEALNYAFEYYQLGQYGAPYVMPAEDQRSWLEKVIDKYTVFNVPPRYGDPEESLSDLQLRFHRDRYGEE